MERANEVVPEMVITPLPSQKHQHILVTSYAASTKLFQNNEIIADKGELYVSTNSITTYSTLNTNSVLLIDTNITRNTNASNLTYNSNENISPPPKPPEEPNMYEIQPLLFLEVSDLGRKKTESLKEPPSIMISDKTSISPPPLKPPDIILSQSPQPRFVNKTRLPYFNSLSQMKVEAAFNGKEFHPDGNFVIPPIPHDSPMLRVSNATLFQSKQLDSISKEMQRVPKSSSIKVKLPCPLVLYDSPQIESKFRVLHPPKAPPSKPPYLSFEHDNFVMPPQPSPKIHICLSAEIIRADFPNGFVFGTASSSFQYAGAVKEDGRGPSVWDTFSHNSSKVIDFSNADVAVDHYHRYQEDIQLLVLHQLLEQHGPHIARVSIFETNKLSSNTFVGYLEIDLLEFPTKDSVSDIEIFNVLYSYVPGKVVDNISISCSEEDPRETEKFKLLLVKEWKRYLKDMKNWIRTIPAEITPTTDPPPKTSQLVSCLLQPLIHYHTRKRNMKKLKKTKILWLFVQESHWNFHLNCFGKKIQMGFSIWELPSNMQSRWFLVCQVVD
ncbi:uncharacterized protein LOC131622163 [Vicia villosa]|uniref:uncharacterized protein LOC131622163 n=1 Tax=Vicia villosa TaxID=3911 RepID=UPI00273A9A8D|nr:uncharacterized protein LOC131622163 [Vicia villosa]